MKNKLTITAIVIVILAVFIGGLLIGSNFLTGIAPISNALDKIIDTNTVKVIEHDEHFGLLLQNGDMIEFSKDISLSDADIVILINVAEIQEGVINTKNLPACPPPGKKLETGKFCYVPKEVLEIDEPHLAEVYPKGIILRPFDI